jgi:hypothetical protein
MNIITAIEYLGIAMIAVYLIGIAMVWFYELKRNALYHRMKEQVKLLETHRFSMAVMHAKTYKITEDYRRTASMLEGVQQFILKNVLLIRNIQNSLSPSRANRR